MTLLDANVVLRYLLNDNAEQASTAEAVISTKQVTILLGVLAEIVYVLTGVYNVPRKETSRILVGFGKLDNVIYEEEQIAFEALEFFSSSKIDFIDSMLYAFHKIGAAEIVSFDKKLNSLLSQLINPSNPSYPSHPYNHPRRSLFSFRSALSAKSASTQTLSRSNIGVSIS